jgi:2-phospho-L-lactate guanylyltransferase
MSGAADIWAVVPVKDAGDAKQRLAHALTPAQRRELALAMVEDVLDALAAAPGLAGLAVVTADSMVRELAAKRRFRVLADDAQSGHTAAVAGAARRLAAEGRGGMLAVPGDIPLVGATEIARLLRAHGRAPAFTISPAHDSRGSNAVICSPPDAVPLKFGNDSFLPHVAAARALGIEPAVLHLPGVGLDIDNPEDIEAFMRVPSRTRARRVLERAGFGAATINGERAN